MNSSCELPPWTQTTRHLKGPSPMWPQLCGRDPGRTTAPPEAGCLRSQVMVMRPLARLRLRILTVSVALKTFDCKETKRRWTP